MKYYREIKLLDDTEIAFGFLWSKLYMQLHLALVEIKDENGQVDIGFSFPKYNDTHFPLGDRIRIFASSEERMETLNLEKFLERLEDYFRMTPTQKVPEHLLGYERFSRVRFKSNAQMRRLAKRRAQREQISYEESLDFYQETQKKYERLKANNKLPFVQLISLSTREHMKIFIDRQQVDKHIEGKFTTYGLSSNATVPAF